MKNRQVAKGFYYWKSEFRLNTQELKAMQHLKITRLYLKFFDVIWDKELNSPSPVSVIRFTDKVPEGVAIIPSIYITNETLLNLPKDQIPLLVENLYRK
ncbi:MAG TPA: hypothetical protein VEC37_03925, partial [Bacillota bacterium]|nr:hypothetical protein [Bacillota bacterium]